MKTDPNKPSPAKPGNKPVHVIRVSGIYASIWQNDTAQGPRFNATFQRKYRDGETWKTSDSFGQSDLATLAFVAQEALRWIAQRYEQQGMQQRG